MSKLEICPFFRLFRQARIQHWTQINNGLNNQTIGAVVEKSNRRGPTKIAISPESLAAQRPDFDTRCKFSFLTTFLVVAETAIFSKNGRLNGLKNLTIGDHRKYNIARKKGDIMV
jgi:hypothetical protein